MGESDPKIDESTEVAAIAQETVAQNSADENSAEQERAGGGTPVHATDDDANNDADASEEPESAPDEHRMVRNTERIDRLFRIGEEPALFRFARWGGPVRLAVLGLDDQESERMRRGVGAAAEHAGVELDASAGGEAADIYIICCSEWGDLADWSGLEALAPDAPRLIAALSHNDADRHVIYRCDANSGLRQALMLTRPNADQAPSPDVQAAQLGVQAMLMLSEQALDEDAPVSARRSGRVGAKQWCANLLAAAYATDIPVYSENPDLAALLSARVEAAGSRNQSRRGRRRSSRATVEAPQSDEHGA